MKRITYYIGLETPTGPNESTFVGVRRAQALDLLAGVYDALTVTDTVGMWEGVEEPSLRVEVIIGEPEDEAGFSRIEQAREIAREIALTLEQDAVALTVEPLHHFQLITKD